MELWLYSFPKAWPDFADDIDMIIVAQDIKEVKILTKEGIREIKHWLEGADLALAKHQTELVVITKRKKWTSTKIRIGKDIMHSQPAPKYPEVMIDQNLHFLLAERLPNRRPKAKPSTSYLQNC